MTGRVFVDTNVFVYQVDSRDQAKQERARAWLDFLWSARTGAVSFQVLLEFYSTVTTKLDPGLAPETARRVVRSLWAWKPLVVDEKVLTAAWALQDRFELSWWDALIAGAARVAGCSILLTEDLQDGQDLEGLTVVSPFRAAPPSLP